MSGRISRKWRPGLGLVLGCTLVAVVSLPLFGVGAALTLCRGDAAPMDCNQAVWVVGALVLISVAYVGYVFWRTLLRPISSLASRAERIKSGDAGGLAPLTHYGTREIGEMGQAMLDMGRVLQGREAVLRSYADHVTHELKSPLTVLRGAAELLASPDLPEAERARLLSRIDEAAARMTSLLDAQHALARAQEPLAAGSARISEVATDIQGQMSGIEIVVAEDAVVALAPDGVRLILEHLIGNAAGHGATRITLTASTDRIEVADNGPGISAGNADRIFDPFFTTRRDSGGTGMGLSIVQRMLEAHGGSIRLANPGEAGAQFVIDL